MSQATDSLLDRKRLEDIASNEAAGPMHVFRVQIKRGAVVRCSFEAMGADSMTVAEQHEGLCERGEYVRVFQEPRPC